MQEADFDQYLITKKINPGRFKEGMITQYTEFKLVFNEVSPSSFTAQKLFWLNRLRRQFPLSDQEHGEQ
jgi:hypothetical protein